MKISLAVDRGPWTDVGGADLNGFNKPLRLLTLRWIIKPRTTALRRGNLRFSKALALYKRSGLRTIASQKASFVDFSEFTGWTNFPFQKNNIVQFAQRRLVVHLCSPSEFHSRSGWAVEFPDYALPHTGATNHGTFLRSHVFACGLSGFGPSDPRSNSLSIHWILRTHFQGSNHGLRVWSPKSPRSREFVR